MKDSKPSGKTYMQALKYCPPQPTGPRPGNGQPTNIPKAVANPPVSKVGLK